MTNYSPLFDARDETGNPVTPSDMVDAGYDDFEEGGDMGDVPAHIASALAALDGQIFDDPAKWHIVNELVAAMYKLDEQHDIETEVTVSEYNLDITFEPDGSANR